MCGLCLMRVLSYIELLDAQVGDWTFTLLDHLDSGLYQHTS
jgi:hypothetical protein